MPRSLSVLCLLVVFAAQATSQDLQGAGAALRAVQAKKAKPASGTRLTKRITDFGFGRGLAPAEAAKGWLGLFDAYTRGPKNDDPSAPFAMLVSALPSPDSWDAIAAGLRSRESAKKGFFPDSVRLFAAVLKGNAAEEWRALDALAPYAKNPKMAGYVASSILQATAALAERTGDRTRIVAAFLASLPAKDGSTLVVPDLVTLVGSQKAEALLLRAMTTSPRAVDTVKGKATRALAQRIALAHVKELKAPTWGLVDPDTLKLYEALNARFGGATPKPARGEDYEASMRDSSRNRARTVYGFGLLKAGRRAEAAKILASITTREVYVVQNAANEVMAPMLGTHEFTAFLGGTVANRPNSPFWDLYTVAAARSRESGVVVASLQRALADPKIPAAARGSLSSRLANALFAADRVDEGLAALRKAIALPSESGETGEALAVKLARIGHLLDRPAVVEEGLALARNARAKAPTGRMDPFLNDGGIVDLLLDLGRGAEAEKEAIKAYVDSVGPQTGGYYGGMAQPQLAALARVYYRLDRPADVKALLDGAEEWGVRDAMDLVESNSGYSESGGESMGFIVAWALAKTGETAAAEAMLGRVLAANGGFDPAYALLLELKGADAIPRLDAIYAADQFQERPLIWKAVALKNAGRLDEAEATVRKAISVDPSDGETHGGHRLYAYTVLADILEAKGDAEGAKGNRDAVAAIRLAEKADELTAVGLLTRAIAGYEESTRRFSDAYCIQSRLAVDLMEQGREKEAEEHYRRAYELMPDSFGRVETHCMGCEHVFEGEIAQNTAERVFTALVKKTPNKPQVHYLLGFLRLEQGRFAEALALTKRAVALDPDYLNAWKQIKTISAVYPVSMVDQKAFDAAIVRLDPLGKHGYGETPSGDPRDLWRRVETAIVRLGAAGPATAYPLAASAAKMASSGMSMDEDFEMTRGWGMGMRNATTPGMALTSDPLFGGIIGLVDNSRSANGSWTITR